MQIPTQEILKYVNLVRAYPKYYVPLIEQQLHYFADDFNIQLQDNILYQTIEGKSVWQEAKTFLIAQQPLRPLELHQGLTKATCDHVIDIAGNKSNGHQGSDGSSFVDRIQRYCKKGKGNMIELIGSTHKVQGKSSIELALLNLIIDDGVSNRGHRKALFNKDYKFMGVSFLDFQDKVISVLAMTQCDLQLIKPQPQHIGTSTTHLKTYVNLQQGSQQVNEVSKGMKQNKNSSQSQSKTQKNRELGKRRPSAQKNIQANSSLWSFKQVGDQAKISQDCLPTQKQCDQPSIFKQINDSNHQLKTDKQFQKPLQSSKSPILNQPCEEKSRKHIKHLKSKGKLKQSTVSVKSSQQQAKKENQKMSATQEFGLSSQVQKFKLKSHLNSPFSRSDKISSYGSSVNKRVVEKKQTIRSWLEDDFLVKEIMTIVKYQDGTVEDIVEKHSVLKSEISLKEASI